ncbi:MAG: hypothetical protein JZU53_18155 [Paludibacter sp.]|nr:hypothetical protein [Paludibacter sp.]
MIYYLAPLFIGSVVGWMLYYFMRKYKVFSPQTLVATISAFLGGEGLNFLISFKEKSYPFDLWYLFGVGIGFFVYAIYVGILSILFVNGKIKNIFKFEATASCGINSIQIFEEFEKLEKFIEFEKLLHEWDKHKIDDVVLVKRLNRVNYLKSDYYRDVKSGKVEFDQSLMDRFEDSKAFDEFK